MMTCIACDAELDLVEVEVGETVICGDCGAEMEVVNARPIELELIEEADEGEDLDADDDDDELEEDEEEDP